jgi:3',5'-cyclic AMP phosphodiesterase CpdA
MVGGSRLRFALVLAALAVGCGAGSGSDTQANDQVGTKADKPADPTDPATVDDTLAERPWEVVSNKGETYLSNVFYAEPIENEQIMPWVIDGRAAIDRLIYPTIGNPNLYVKDDAKDELVMVLRMEDDAIAHLAPKRAAGQGLAPTELALTQDDANQIAFLLVAKSARSATEAASAQFARNGVYPIKPKKILINAEPDEMPAALKQRHTVRFVFDQASLAGVPAGLYDARFEVRKSGQVYANVFEYQYNAVRVFDHESDEYTALNVTDTQVSVGVKFDTLTAAKLDDFVDAVNASSEPTVRNAAFITFNGDLHNGGAPGTILQNAVATTYNSEAKRILSSLKRLDLPIFLTPGNHDGYVGLGHVPDGVASFEKLVGNSLEKVVGLQNNRAWPGFAWNEYSAWLAKTPLDGLHRDIVTGAFERKDGKTFGQAWKEVPRADRNYILYDGFYQWQKTYGPLYYSYKFGKNTYVSLNSYELRQHRRSGWGMYTVNYGGGMSDVQMAWLDRELLRAKVEGTDVVLLAHHDPRGGHKGKDLGYYFDQLRFRSVYQSAFNYLVSKVWNGFACELPDWAISTAQQDSCIHDGLQEWMRPDEDFDCGWDERNGQGLCDAPLFDPAQGASAHAYFFSGLELMKRLSQSPQIRTVLLGHTHYNSLEVLQTGDELVPGKMPVDGASVQRFATLEVENPIRGFSVLQEGTAARTDYSRNAVPFLRLAARTQRFAALLENAMPEQRFLDAPVGAPRELVVLRLVSNADLANQTYQGKSALGFSVLHVAKKTDARKVTSAQINKATFFVNGGSGQFANIRTVDIDRMARMAPHDASNPLTAFYSW